MNAGSSPAENRFQTYVERVYTPHSDALIRAMVKGDISLDECEIAMLQELDYLIYTAFRAGNNGGDLSPADMTLVRQKIAEQHDYLHAWFDELRAKRDARDAAVAVGVIGIGAAAALSGLFNTAALIARAALYARTARSFVAVMQTLALGMPLLPAYPRDNTSECLMNDACTWEIVPTGPNSWDCYWRLDPLAESCPNCLKRAEVWNPLVIENGVIQPYDATGLFA